MATLTYSRDGSLVLFSKGIEGTAAIRESKNPQLKEIITRRAESDINAPIWASDESTGSYVFYRPGESPLFIPKLDLKITKLDLNSNEKEIWVHPSARDYLTSISTSQLPAAKSRKELTDFGKVVNSLFRVPLAAGEEYARKLESAGLNSFSLHVLSPERVIEEGDDFLRYIRLKGVHSGAFNPGGIVCDGRTYFKRNSA